MTRAAAPRVALTGLGLVAAYVVLAAGLHLSGWRVRPLYDTIAPPPPYRWVRPPPLFAPGNVAPESGRAEIPLVSGRSVSTSVATPDGQCVVAFAAGAISSSASPSSASPNAEVVIEPIDPRTLAGLPDGLQAVGNAYDIRITIDGAPIPVLRIAADVVMETPEPAQTLAFSSDGRTWTRTPTRPVNGYSTLGSPSLLQPGYVVAGTTGAATVAHRGGTVVVAIAVAMIALVLGSVPALRSALRSRRAQGQTASDV